MTKIIVRNDQGYKAYHNGGIYWKLCTAPSTPPVPPGPDPTEPFYIESRGSAMDVSIKKVNNSAPTVNNIEYSLDKTTWQSLGSTSTTALTINVPAGGKVWLRANTNRWCSSSHTNYNCITTSTQCDVGGNIMSLLYGDTFTGQSGFPDTTINRIFNGLFKDDSSGGGKIVNASKLLLPATTLRDCYSGMFSNCTSLTTAPELPATTLTPGCYGNMFSNCTSLTTAPELPATIVDSYSYNDMFKGCRKLNCIKCLATNISASYAVTGWVSNVASTGTFVKKAGVYWPSGANGIPSGWTVVEE